MTDEYLEFLERKRLTVPAAGIPNPPALSPKLFDFQRDITNWALRRGKAAVFLECGLGKGWIALEWARVVHEHTGNDVLILAPLAVAQQFVREGEKLGVHVNLCRTGVDVRRGINVTNYDRMHHFDAKAFGGVVIDESSLLKSYTGQTRNSLIESFQQTPFRLACTATPAPNDHEELGNHAEFLGIMKRVEMLATWFDHDGGDTGTWILKAHGKRNFWEWCAQWAVCLGSPADLGYDASGYDLPPLQLVEHKLAIDDDISRRAGLLFGYEAKTLNEQRAIRKASIPERVKLASEIVASQSNEQWLVWCELNEESRQLAKAIPGAIEITGSDTPEFKEQAILGFIDGKTRVCVSKSRIAGYGVNLQNCARAVYVGVGHSFEQWHQSTRRIWRFKQLRPVETHVIYSEAEGPIVKNLNRKQREFFEMRESMVDCMRESMRAELGALRKQIDEYKPRKTFDMAAWLKKEGCAA